MRASCLQHRSRRQVASLNRRCRYLRRYPSCSFSACIEYGSGSTYASHRLAATAAALPPELPPADLRSATSSFPSKPNGLTTGPWAEYRFRDLQAISIHVALKGNALTPFQTHRNWPSQQSRHHCQKAERRPSHRKESGSSQAFLTSMLLVVT